MFNGTGIWDSFLKKTCCTFDDQLLPATVNKVLKALKYRKDVGIINGLLFANIGEQQTSFLEKSRFAALINKLKKKIYR